jgi:hypothetical protein
MPADETCSQAAEKIIFISSKETHYRGDDFYGTDMARPFRVSHQARNPFLFDNPSRDNRWSAYITGRNSTQGGDR